MLRLCRLHAYQVIVKEQLRVLVKNVTLVRFVARKPCECGEKELWCAHVLAVLGVTASESLQICACFSISNDLSNLSLITHL